MAAIDALRAGVEQYLRELAETSEPEFRELVESVQPPTEWRRNA